MDYPSLQAGQYAVIHVEAATGVVLRLDGQRHLGRGEVWRVFESIANARDYAASEVRARPTIACVIYDSRHERVEEVQV